MEAVLVTGFVVVVLAVVAVKVILFPGPTSDRWDSSPDLAKAQRYLEKRYPLATITTRKETEASSGPHPGSSTGAAIFAIVASILPKKTYYKVFIDTPEPLGNVPTKVYGCQVYLRYQPKS